MNIWQDLQKAIQYIWQAAKRIFSPNEDQYPETGVQPFEGDAAEDR